MRLEIAASPGSLTGKRQCFPGECCRKLQDSGLKSPADNIDEVALVRRVRLRERRDCRLVRRKGSACEKQYVLRCIRIVLVAHIENFWDVLGQEFESGGHSLKLYECFDPCLGEFIGFLWNGEHLQWHNIFAGRIARCGCATFRRSTVPNP